MRLFIVCVCVTCLCVRVVYLCPPVVDAPQAVVLCGGKLYLVKDNYQDWPLSKFTTMRLQDIPHPQYTVTNQVQITDVQSLVSCAGQLWYLL